MPTLADFDGATQERATTALNRFLPTYKITGAMIHADELGEAVKAALSGGSASDPGFVERLFDQLYRPLHRRMTEYAARGQAMPSGLDREGYLLLRRSLEQRFGALPPAPTPPAGAGVAIPTVDHRPASERMVEHLAGLPVSHDPIDPAAATALRREGDPARNAPTRPDRPGSNPSSGPQAVHVYRVTEAATGRVVEVGVPGPKPQAGADLYMSGPLGVDLTNRLRALLDGPEAGRIAMMGGAAMSVDELRALARRPGALTISAGPIKVIA